MFELLLPRIDMSFKQPLIQPFVEKRSVYKDFNSLCTIEESTPPPTESGISDIRKLRTDYKYSQPTSTPTNRRLHLPRSIRWNVPLRVRIY